mgnify:CR=1 FL=1
MVRLSFLCMALATACVSLSVWLPLTMTAVGLSGGAWVVTLALFNTSVQLSTPRWVVGRALSFYQMATFGGMALGSWIFGRRGQGIEGDRPCDQRRCQYGL